MSLGEAELKKFVELIGGMLRCPFNWNHRHRLSVLPLIPSDHANRLPDDVKVKVLEVVVRGKREVLVNVVLVPSPKSCVDVRFVPTNLFHTLVARIYVLQYIHDIVSRGLFWPNEL